MKMMKKHQPLEIKVPYTLPRKSANDATWCHAQHVSSIKKRQMFQINLSDYSRDWNMCEHFQLLLCPALLQKKSTSTPYLASS